MHYTYMAECRDGSLYTGYTTDVERRISEHNSGKGAKYTRSRLPVRLAYYEAHATKQEAMSREYQIKQLTREEKLKLVEKFHGENKKNEFKRHIESFIGSRKKNDLCIPGKNIIE